MTDREADTKAYDDYRSRVSQFVTGLDIWRAALAYERAKQAELVKKRSHEVCNRPLSGEGDQMNNLADFGRWRLWLSSGTRQPT